MNKKIAVFTALSAFTLLGGCATETTDSKTSTAATDEDLTIVTTFYPMYDFTRNVVGDEGDVSLLLGSGTEPHDYELSASDVAKIQDADVFVYNDENMETWVPSLADTLAEGEVTVIRAAENILFLPGTEEEGGDHDESEEGHSHELDPHVWLAPSLAIKEVATIRDQLIAAYPEKEEAFQKNAEAYLAKLIALDEEYKENLQNADQKNFVTQHAAFGYLALEYGLTQVPIAGLSPSQEPSPTRLAELKEYIEENAIEYIYFEENASDKIAQTLADEANVQLAVLNPLESLTEEQQENGADYISIMKDNLAALVKTTGSTTGNETILPENETVEKTAAQGYFEDAAVKDRDLSDWEGEWQSVYPYLEDGTLDQVFDYKAKLKKDKTAAEYKEYYAAGYVTNVDDIVIEGDTINFVYDGTDHRTTYAYAGKEILTYEAGNRGVRYLFEATEDVEGAFKYIQFSDHIIEPTKAEHYHIYFGNESQESLLNEMDNWPTYYPSELTGKEVAQEMMAH